MKKENLPELAGKALAGDTAALSQLLELCYKDLYYYAYATVKNEEQAADVTQESCLEIISTVQNLREPKAFLTWAKRIVYHQCTRYFKETREVPFEENEDGESLLDRLPDEDPGSLPEQVQEDKEFRALMQSMLDSLPGPQRSALMYYYYERLSVSQIAQIQGTTEGTVKSRLNYGRKAIKEQVETYEKKTGVRLHSITPLPLLLYYLFRQEAAQVSAHCAGLLTKVWGSISSAIGGTAAAGAVAGTAAGATAGTAAAGAGLGLGAKIAAGVLAAVVAVGTTVGIVVSNSSQRICQQTAAQFQGIWVTDDYEPTDPETYFQLHEDGTLDYSGQTFYIHNAEKLDKLYDQAGNLLDMPPLHTAAFSPDPADLYRDTAAADALSFVFELPAEDRGGYCAILTAPGQDRSLFFYRLDPVYLEPGGSAHYIPPVRIEDATRHLGLWESRSGKDTSLEILENNTARYGGETLSWEWSMPDAPYPLLTLTNGAGEPVYTAMVDQLEDFRPCLVLAPADALDAQGSLYYYDKMAASAIDMFYRPADYPGYTRVTLTAENALRYLTSAPHIGWISQLQDDQSSNIVSIYSLSPLAFREKYGQASFCVGEFSFRVGAMGVQVDLDALTYTLGGMTYTRGQTIPEDIAERALDKRQSTQLLHAAWQVDGGITFSGYNNNTVDGPARQYEELVPWYALTGVTQIEGFVLIPPLLEP